MSAGTVLGGVTLGCVLLANASASAAASFVLTEAGKQSALAYGKSTAHRDAFDAEWRVKNAAGDVVNVITPFHRLVIASRHATFRDEPMTPGEPDKLLRELKDRLMLEVELHGRSGEFARLLVPELRVGERTIKAAFVQPDHAPLHLEDGGYLARCVFTFPVKELTGAARVTLVVRDRDEREMSRFAIDLSRMR